MGGGRERTRDSTAGWQCTPKCSDAPFTTVPAKAGSRYGERPVVGEVNVLVANKH